ncbi:hypothetical protein NAV33_12115 [Pseudomonas stutzeri]|nr:hypothetical protein [Stutzerimonas stutzeri]MCQ4312636.1 hypothetical protein [Stutzerimonas stutzeri]
MTMVSTRHARRLLRASGVMTLALLLGACAGNPYQASKPTPTPTPPVSEPQEPVASPPPVRTPPAPRPPATQKSHPRYAPPPHAAAHWDNRLGVYVVEGRNMFYRERLYYRWDGDWYCAGRPDGPWEPVALPSVPTGLRSLH